MREERERHIQHMEKMEELAERIAKALERNRSIRAWGKPKST